MGVWQVYESAYGKDVFFREIAVDERLVEFCQRASVNRLSVGDFCEDVSQSGLKRLGFWHVLGCL